tara:strand:+ start:2503 stop:3423 length:921 start_codon:yes stop_codon:yes gene_type:complete
MSKKIVFMGTPEFAVPTLETLASSDYEVVCVYTQRPKKSSRGLKLNPSAVQIAAEKLNLTVKCPTNLNDEKEYNFFKALNPFITIVVAYGKIIPKKYFNLSKKGFINIHASLLPKWRGAAPIQRSIINHDKESGISVMKIIEGLDNGPYMRQVKVNIDGQTTSGVLSKKLSFLGASNVLDCLNLIKSNSAKFIDQDDQKATYAKKIDKLESKIQWDKNAKDILSKINGLNPSPGAWLKYEGQRFKVWKAKISENKGNPGEILEDNFVVACKDKSIEILEIQKEGKGILPIKNFLTGNKIYKGKNIF